MLIIKRLLNINGIDSTCELPEGTLENTNIKFTSNEEDLKQASFFVISVPTPINDENRPDFKYIFSASETVGKYVKKMILLFMSQLYILGLLRSYVFQSLRKNLD